MAAIFSANRLPCRKKSILAEVCFEGNRGVVGNAGGMNFYLIKSLFAPVLGLFAAICSAICR